MKTALTVAMMMLSTPALSDQLISDGSGVAISSDQILTANHVIDGCTRVTFGSSGNWAATVAARDPTRDLAVLSVPWGMSEVVSLRDEPLNLGESVIVTGFPLYGYMASSLNLTTGNVSALAGYKDDLNSYTLTAPVQPGNSGGPVLDERGHLVGIVTSRLDKSSDGQSAQNVNFAVKSSVIASFLQNHHVKYQTASVDAKMTTAEVGKRARLFTVKINCYSNRIAEAPTEPSSPSQPSPSPPSQSGGGYWSAVAYDNSCLLTSGFTDGRSLGLGLTRNFGLFALLAKPSWSIPSGVRVAASVQIDNWQPLSGPGRSFPEWPNTMAIPVQPRFYNALVDEMKEGWWATVRFTGNEPPWQVSLWGVKAAWPAFLQCARRVSPMFVNQLYSPTTQPW